MYLRAILLIRIQKMSYWKFLSPNNLKVSAIHAKLKTRYQFFLPGYFEFVIAYEEINQINFYILIFTILSSFMKPNKIILILYLIINYKLWVHFPCHNKIAVRAVWLEKQSIKILVRYLFDCDLQCTSSLGQTIAGIFWPVITH